MIAALRGHESGLTGAVFSPDGKRILTASHDATARLWTADGSEIAALHGHRLTVTSAVFSPDGEQILTASRDRTLRLWPHWKDPQALIDYAAEIVARLEPLTKRERFQFYLDIDGCGTDE